MSVHLHVHGQKYLSVLVRDRPTESIQTSIRAKVCVFCVTEYICKCVSALEHLSLFPSLTFSLSLSLSLLILFLAHSLSLSLSLSLFLFMYLSIYLLKYPPIGLSIYLFAYLFVNL